MSIVGDVHKKFEEIMPRQVVDMDNDEIKMRDEEDQAARDVYAASDRLGIFPDNVVGKAGYFLPRLN